MRASILIAIAGAASLAAAAAAFAQADNATNADTAVNPPAASADTSNAVNSNPQGGFASSDTLGDTSKLKAGDPDVVSNGPVPDTRENRAKYGRPMSQAGRSTRPTGD